MVYRIAFGADTESLEDPDQLVLMSLPDEVSDMDSDELVSYINDEWTDLNHQPLVGFTDVLESLWLLLDAEGVSEDVRLRVAAGLADALDNNS